MKVALLEHVWQLLIVAAILLFATTLYFVRRAKKQTLRKTSIGRNRPRHPRPQNGRTKNSRFADDGEIYSSKTGLILGSVMVILAGWLAASLIYPKTGPAPETPLNNSAAMTATAPGSPFAKGNLSFLSPASQAANELINDVRQAGTPATPTSPLAAPAETAPTATPNTTPSQTVPSAPQAAAATTAPSRQTTPPAATNAAPKPTAASAPAEPSGLLSQNTAGQKTKTTTNSANKPSANNAPKPNKPETDAAKTATTTQNATQNTNSILGTGREFTVHLGSFKDAKNAEDYKSKLSQAGSSAFVSEAVQGGVTWYRVMSGRFSTRNEAMEHGLDLKRQGLTPANEQFLIKPVN